MHEHTLEWLDSPAARLARAAYQTFAPEAAALALRKEFSAEETALLATQIKLAQKATEKLPAWVAAGCLFSDELLQMATATAVQALRPVLSGTVALDGTLGLGSDAVHLAEHFSAVTALDTDPAAVQLARWNVRKLGRSNLQIHVADVTQALKDWQGPLDLAFLDPARRAGARKTVGLAQGTPDVFALLPLLQQKAARVRFKLSPLVELTELTRLLPGLVRIAVISWHNEVKEVLADLDFEAPAEGPEISARGESGRYGRFVLAAEPSTPEPETRLEGRFLLDADVGIRKAGLLAEAAHQAQAAWSGPTGFLVAETAPVAFPGRVYRLAATFPYQPKAVAKYLKAKQIRAVQVHPRHVRIRAAEVRKRFNLLEGETDHLFIAPGPGGKAQCWHAWAD